ncbi:MAG: hypothetical protein ACRD1Z_07435, partial [Vicinamibacteria bacterium]
AYAYSRCAGVTLPFMLLLLSWLFVEMLAKVPLLPTWTIRAALIGGMALVAVSFAVGPLGFRRTDDGPYSALHTSLFPLPAFDLPFDETPQFYSTLKEEKSRVRIIEAPVIIYRGRFLYRNYYFQHGRETWLSFLDKSVGGLPEGPYVSLSDPEQIRESGADYLVLHLDLERESARYWEFVFGREGAGKRFPGAQACMTRHLYHTSVLPSPPAELIRRLSGAFGAPVYRDTAVLVWKIHPHPRPRSPRNGTLGHRVEFVLKRRGTHCS